MMATSAFNEWRYNFALSPLQASVPFYFDAFLHSAINAAEATSGHRIIHLVHMFAYRGARNVSL